MSKPSELATVPGEEGEVLDWEAPRWAAPISLLLCVFGMAVASYLTYAHYTDAKNLACSDNGVINCAKVTTSAQSHFLGMPVAVLGLAYFVGMTVLCLPWLWRRPERIVRLGRLAGAIAGVAMVLWLVYAELFIIDAICLWCTVVHALTVLLFVTVASATVVGMHGMEIATELDEEYDDEFEGEDDEVGTDVQNVADSPAEQRS